MESARGYEGKSEDELVLVEEGVRILGEKKQNIEDFASTVDEQVGMVVRSLH